MQCACLDWQEISQRLSKSARWAEIVDLGEALFAEWVPGGQIPKFKITSSANASFSIISIAFLGEDEAFDEVVVSDGELYLVFSVRRSALHRLSATALGRGPKPRERDASFQAKAQVIRG